MSNFAEMLDEERELLRQRSEATEAIAKALTAELDAALERMERLVEVLREEPKFPRRGGPFRG